ncbi:hypothetical protein ACQXZ4_12310, partial [Corynebacterium diphtheriae]
LAQRHAVVCDDGVGGGDHGHRLPAARLTRAVPHLNPLMGLYGAFIICTLTALFGRPGRGWSRGRRGRWRW